MQNMNTYSPSNYEQPGADPFGSGQVDYSPSTYSLPTIEDQKSGEHLSPKIKRLANFVLDKTVRRGGANEQYVNYSASTRSNEIKLNHQPVQQFNEIDPFGLGSGYGIEPIATDSYIEQSFPDSRYEKEQPNSGSRVSKFGANMLRLARQVADNPRSKAAGKAAKRTVEDHYGVSFGNGKQERYITVDKKLKFGREVVKTALSPSTTAAFLARETAIASGKAFYNV